MGKRKLFEEMDLFTAEIVVMISWVYTYLQTHVVVHIKYVQIFVCQSYLKKKIFKKGHFTSNLPLTSSCIISFSDISKELHSSIKRERERERKRERGVRQWNQAVKGNKEQSWTF